MQTTKTPPKCAVNRYCTLYKKENLKKSKKIFAKVRKLQKHFVSLHYNKALSNKTRIANKFLTKKTFLP